MTLTRQEIRWMLRFVEHSRDNSKALKDMPGQQYAALHQLEYDNMTALAAKLEHVLESGIKRIGIS